MSAFAWWEWLVFIIGVYGAWAIGYNSGAHYGAARGARAAYETILKQMETIATNQNSAAEKLTTVCDMFRQTVIVLDRVGKRMGGES